MIYGEEEQMPVLIAIILLWLLAAWIANDAACKTIEMTQPWLLKAIEWALLACFI